MGTGYKGNSAQYRSIGQNIMAVSQQYGFKNGFFGDNSAHGNKKTRNIASTDNLITAKDFYDKIAFGGKKQIISSNMRITRMHDGTVITMRIVSHSDGTPVVNINIKNSSHNGGVKTQKIHFIVGDQK